MGGRTDLGVAEKPSSNAFSMKNWRPICSDSRGVSMRAGVSATFDAVIQRALAKEPDARYATWDEFAQALSSLIVNQDVPRGQLQGVLDSERFNLLRSLDFNSYNDKSSVPGVNRNDLHRYDTGARRVERDAQVQKLQPECSFERGGRGLYLV